MSLSKAPRETPTLGGAHADIVVEAQKLQRPRIRLAPHPFGDLEPSPGSITIHFDQTQVHGLEDELE